MTPKDVFDVSADVRDIFVRTGVFGADGNWADPMPPRAVIQAVAEIEQALVQRGAGIPEALTQYFKIAELIAPMVK